MDEAGFYIDHLDLCDCFSNLSSLYLRQIPVRLSVLFLHQKVCDPAFDLTSDSSHFLLQEKDSRSYFLSKY